MMQWHLDGDFVSAVPPLQSLALHGYAVFTTGVAYQQDGAWWIKGLDLHQQRLHRDALALFGIAPDNREIGQALRHFLSQDAIPSALTVRISVFPRDFSIATPEAIEHLHILISGRPLTPCAPLRLTSIDATRIFPLHKTGNLLINLSARRQARLTGADDALLCISNMILEGAGWNIFFSDGKRLFTPPLKHLLPGVTRRLLMSAASADGIEVQEIEIQQAQIAAYRSAFATNAVCGVTPIAELDGVSFDVNCTMIRRMRDLYAALAGMRV